MQQSIYGLTQKLDNQTTQINLIINSKKAISSSLKDVTVITELTMSVIEADKEEPKDKISK